VWRAQEDQLRGVRGADSTAARTPLAELPELGAQREAGRSRGQAGAVHQR
jgi:hypothetical protein